MSYINRDFLHIFFADKQHEVARKDIKESRFSLVNQQVVKQYGLDRMIVLDQQHQ